MSGAGEVGTSEPLCCEASESEKLSSVDIVCAEAPPMVWSPSVPAGVPATSAGWPGPGCSAVVHTQGAS